MNAIPKIFERENHKIILGDALDSLQSLILDSSIDLIFADPPYNIGKDFNGRKDKWDSDEAYLEWCYQWLNLCVQKLKPHGSFYVMTSTQAMPFFDIYLRKTMTVLSRIVWHYDSSGVQAKRYYGSMYEPILFCVKDKGNYTFNSEAVLVEAKTGAKRKLIDYRKPIPTVYNSQKVPGNVWEIPRVRYRMGEYENHPTQKPVALLERIILASSNPGDMVL
ncbi:MAG: adenine-specific DNA-methyltransferase, partial [Anaerolineae bacterium CG1_02_58_13]